MSPLGAPDAYDAATSGKFSGLEARAASPVVTIPPAPLRERPLLRAEDPVAGVTQARQDIAVRVELAIDRGRVDRDVGMRFVERRDALGARDETDHPDRSRPRL